MRTALVASMAALLAFSLASPARANDHAFSNRGHYDYHPGHYDRHRGHWDYHPGHYDYHRGPHQQAGFQGYLPSQGGYYPGRNYAPQHPAGSGYPGSPYSPTPGLSPGFRGHR
jgi:hypothetical protein